MYRKADIDILGLASIVAGLLIFYGEQILGIWINPNTAAQAALPLVWLSVGFGLALRLPIYTMWRWLVVFLGNILK